MTTLYVNGCSWSAGVELNADRSVFDPWVKSQGIPEELCKIEKFYNLYNYGAYFSKMIEADNYINQAVGGGSNQRMIRTTLDFIRRTDPGDYKNLIVILGWTSTERAEIFVDHLAIRGWYKLNMNQPFKEHLMSTDLDRITAAEHTVKLIEEYQNYHLMVGNSLYKCLTDYFNQQMMMKNTLENLGIKYLFFNSVPAWWDHWLDFNIYQEFPIELEFSSYPNNLGIRPQEAMQTFCDGKFPHAPNGHVLKEGHEAWAWHLFDRYKEIYNTTKVNKSIWQIS